MSGTWEYIDMNTHTQRPMFRELTSSGLGWPYGRAIQFWWTEMEAEKTGRAFVERTRKAGVWRSEHVGHGRKQGVESHW